MRLRSILLASLMILVSFSPVVLAEFDSKSVTDSQIGIPVQETTDGAVRQSLHRLHRDLCRNQRLHHCMELLIAQQQVQHHRKHNIRRSRTMVKQLVFEESVGKSLQRSDRLGV